KLDDLPLMKLEDVLLPPIHNPSTPSDFMRYEFFRKLCALPHMEKILLYGSRARGEQTPDSDIDLLLYCDPPPTRRQWLEICDIVEAADVPFEIDCKLYCDSLHTVLRMELVQASCRTLYQ